MKFVKLIFSIIIVVVIAVVTYMIWPEQELPKGTKADKLVVYKSVNRMELWANGELIKTYKISLGGNPIGHKQHEGDSKTPEGLYYINDRNPNSQFHLNLGISYPNEKDELRTEPGGDIKYMG